jgi:hypothetical protein
MNTIAKDILRYLSQKSVLDKRTLVHDLLSSTHYPEQECMTALIQLAAAGLVEHPSRLFRDEELETRITKKGRSVAQLLATGKEPMIQVRAFPYDHLGFASFQIEILPVPIDCKDMIDKITKILQDSF